ncbi:Zinc finger protein ZAT9 [Linum perenne]
MADSHKCKLCFRLFPNGRALGGHMKAHFHPTTTAAFPLPPKSPTTPRRRSHDLDATESSSSSSYSSPDEEEEGEETELKFVKSDVVYGLRENPRKSFRVADPEFSFSAAAAVVQDRESETESRNPTRRRSKRTRKPGEGVLQGWASDSPVSSVSDASPADEDVAMCLVMLSRDVNWRSQKKKKRRFNNVVDFEEAKEEEEEEEEVHGKKKLKCEKCMKQFRSIKALTSHRRICSLNDKGQLRSLITTDVEEKIFQCPYCFKVFGSGQALGGHKRSHLSGTGTSSAATRVDPPLLPRSTDRSEKTCSLWDLNLPAAEEEEEEEFSVVSDA